MEGVPALRQIIEKDDLMCKLDLKDAYVVVPIHPASQQYLTFKHQGVVYQYKSMAFGLSVAPRVFTKIMRYALEPLRRKGIRFVYYLDDICVLEKTSERMTQVTQLIIKHLTKLGFLINWEKSVLIPSHAQEFLGFVFNTEKMSISVPAQKLQKLMMRLKQILNHPLQQRSCRWIASLVGKMTAMIPAIEKALLHLRYMQRDLAKSLHLHHQNWEAPCHLSHESQEELRWWKDFASTRNGLDIQKPAERNPDLTIRCDASDLGWGVSSHEMEISGQWTNEEKTTSINVRELKTILFALKLHAEKFREKNIRIHRQYNSTEIFDQGRRDSFTTSSRISDRNPGRDQLIQLDGDIQPYTRNFECQSRYTKSNKGVQSSIRSNDVQEVVPGNKSEDGSFEDRRLWYLHM
jgi:hypothetical protein